MRRPLTAIALLLMFALPLLAQTRHQIFKIEFRSRIPSSILMTQSALSEDRTYTDEELQLALARLRRLPFVYAASYTIEGSTIVIDVVDEFRIFYHLDSLGQIASSGGGGNGYVSAELGGRYYVPWGGVFKASYGLESESGGRGNTYTAEYAQYGLLGSRLFMVLDVNKPSQSGSTTQPSFLIGYPLTLRQTVFARGFKAKFNDFQRVGAQGSFTTTDEEKHIGIGWRWDTTNDPFFATRGLAAEVERSSKKTSGTALSISSSGRFVFSSERKADLNVWDLSSKYFWPKGRGAFTASASYSDESGEQQFRQGSTNPFTSSDSENSNGEFRVGYALNFFPLISEARHSRHRLEAAIGLDTFRSKSGSHTSTRNFQAGELGYAFRNRWGTFHLVVAYLGD